MGLGQVDLGSIPQEYRNWSQSTDDAKKTIKCSIEGHSVTVVFTRMLFKNDSLAIPNRINVSLNAPKIEETFKKHAWKPINFFPKWDQKVWVFDDEKNLSHLSMQYELRFFPDESRLNRQLEADEKAISEQQLYCLKSDFAKFVDEDSRKSPNDFVL